MKHFAAILFALLVETVFCYCPPDARQSPSRQKCYYFVEFPTTYFQAEEHCQRFGGHLASVTNELEASQILELSLSLGNANPFWIGLDNFATTNDFVWIDNTVSCYTRWDQIGSNPTVVTMPNGKWTTRPSSEQYPFVCDSDNNEQCALACESGWTYYEKTKSCYKVLINYEIFDNAEKSCTDLGAHLTSIHSNDENNFVNKLVMTGQKLNSSNEMSWIGLKADSNRAWSWTDGSPAEPSSFWWADGEPNNRGGTENCVMTYDDMFQGTNCTAERYPCGTYYRRWNDIDCTQTRRASVCKKAAIH